MVYRNAVHREQLASKSSHYESVNRKAAQISIYFVVYKVKWSLFTTSVTAPHKKQVILTANCSPQQ
jgi:hypothetical protein